MSYEEYKAAVARVESKNPKDPLLAVLKSGFSKINVVYLRAALKRITESHFEAEVQVTTGTEYHVTLSPPKNEKKADQTLLGLWKERTHLFGDMNKLSNAFHNCVSDADRKVNSQKIRAVWEQIGAVKERIAYYEEFGKLPPAAQEKEKFPLPDDPVALMKKLASIRAQVSQTQALLRELADLPESHPDRETRIKEAEAKRTHLILYRGHAEEKIKSIHGG